ncbi:unnamed protein product [[Actinomadura] parvosata subsp. kistnae]|uniref:Uncharacterized protein n=1 Tax=[Actinomadura] parvosata subsp. kistnae TaxID=1909395 RepID=A0A1U9ZWW2_9ACTN|nr:hypothetical protein [Nonomuraea sp. ATCC 55076]AQZ62430.1 hypothetical protein BKM31_14025 [Nonomuraea sp. ATCC 55076]SPL88655.1 unnamed protein product [Actinomadura parvosata subsp. kistnae]
MEGAILERLAARMEQDEEFRTSTAELWLKDAYEPPPNGEQRLDAQSVSELTATSGSARYHVLADVIDRDMIADKALPELSNIIHRLRATGSLVPEEFDRLQAEADFRIAMFPPLATLMGVLAIRSSPFWWLGTLAALTLIYVVQPRPAQ